MAYESKIRSFNHDRVTKNTTISQDLLQRIKLLSIEQETSFNYLIEAGIDHVLQTYKKQSDLIAYEKPSDRIQMGTTLSEVKYSQLKDRARKLKTNVNTLIEMGMLQILQRHQGR